MAGAGYKSWVDGDILTAADVNTYLMQQAVMRFADAAARTSAIAAPSEGMVTYLVDTDRIEYYDGAAWQPILDQDVIEAKGDLIVGTGDDTVAALSVGTNGYVLTADSTTATGLVWAAAAGGGKVLQVVSGIYSTEVSFTTATWTDSGLSASITPSSASSKVLVMVSQPTTVYRTSTLAGMSHRLMRDSTDVYETGGTINQASFIRATGATAVELSIVLPMVYVDSPNTTSAITYKTQGRSKDGSNDQVYFQAGSADSSIVLIEIGA